MPPQADAWEKLRPVYHTMPGWGQSTFGITRYENLPKQAREYVQFIVSQIGLEVSIISTGPGRDQTIVLPGSRLDKLLLDSQFPQS
jgi:adenylosuccinate synthase